MLNSPGKCTVVSVSSNVVKQVGLQVNHDESESQHQGGENLHSATESSSHQSTSSEARRPNIALDRARRVGRGPPRRYGFEDMTPFALQVAEEVEVDIMIHPPLKKLFLVASLLNGSLQWETRWSLWIRIRLGS